MMKNDNKGQIIENLNAQKDAFLGLIQEENIDSITIESEDFCLAEFEDMPADNEFSLEALISNLFLASQAENETEIAALDALSETLDDIEPAAGETSQTTSTQSASNPAPLGGRLRSEDTIETDNFSDLDAQGTVDATQLIYSSPLFDVDVLGIEEAEEEIVIIEDPIVEPDPVDPPIIVTPRIRGTRDDDSLKGDEGRDIIQGRRGNDVLYGDDCLLPGSEAMSSELTISFIGSNAGYRNTLGFYEIAEDGTIENIQIVFANVKSRPDGDDVTFEFDGELPNWDMFILANGYSQNRGYRDLDLMSENLSFVYNYGEADARASKIDDNAEDVSLVYDDGETVQLLRGHDYHQAQGLNHDHADHVRVSNLENNDQLFAFEDLPNLGDADFNDVMVSVHTEAHYSFEYGDLVAGNDTLRGGRDDDILVGGKGNDRLVGGRDIDIAVFMGDADEYVITQRGNRTIIEDTIEGRDGRDVLTGVEGILFGVESVMENLLSGRIENDFDTTTWDLSDIIEEYDPLTEAINDFVSAGGTQEAAPGEMIGHLEGFALFETQQAFENQQEAVV